MRVILYIVEVTVALIRVSRDAAFNAIPPHPQIPQIPTLSLSTGDAISRGSPELSPVNEGSKAIVKNPISANVCA